MARVIVSSGHTADNPGVVAYGLREYDLARKIAKYSLKYIRQAGIISLSTPPNLDLAQRIGWINNTGYNSASNDIAIEIHINDGGRRGIEGWFEQDGNNPSQDLTVKIIDSICQDLNLPSQGALSEFQHEMGSISFIHEVEPIACIVECCYIDNAEDSLILGDENKLEQIGRAIAKGIINYFGLNIELPEFSAQAQVVQNPAVQNAQPVQISQPAQTYQQTYQTQPTQYSQPVQQNQIVQTVQPNNIMQPDQPGQYQRPIVQPTPIQNTPSQQLQRYQNYQTPGSNQSQPQYQAPAQYSTPDRSMQPAAAEKPGFLNRDQRKEMIIRNYVKILGREPNENDLNYFLNAGIREDDLIKKMVDSQEHVDLVKARQEVISAKMKMTSEQEELTELRAKVAENEVILKSLNDSITQKNEALTSINLRLRELEQKQNLAPKQEEKKLESSPKEKYKGNLSDRVFKAFSDILE